MRRFQLIRHCVSSPDSSLSDKSFLMLSNHLHFGLPLLLFHGTYITITLLPTHSSSFLNTCQYPFKLLSCSFLDISPTFAIPLIVSFLILSSLATPRIPLNTLIVATYCDFFTAHVGLHWFFCPGSCSFIFILHYHYIIIWQSHLPIAPPYSLTRHSKRTPFLDLYISIPYMKG